MSVTSHISHVPHQSRPTQSRPTQSRRTPYRHLWPGAAAWRPTYSLGAPYRQLRRYRLAPNIANSGDIGAQRYRHIANSLGDVGRQPMSHPVQLRGGKEGGGGRPPRRLPSAGPHRGRDPRRGRDPQRDARGRDPHRQGWQGRAGSLTSAPRPATPVETSAPRPATPSDPGLVRDSPGILHVTPQGDAHHKVCYRSSLHITPAI